MRWGSPDTPFLNASSFHRDFALVACRKRWLRLWILDVNGEPAAASYGFRFAGSESFSKPAAILAFTARMSASCSLRTTYRRRWTME